MHAHGLEITPRPDLPAIVARWQREITAAELRAGYFAILAAADALGCWRWLLDLRRREELASPELTTWVNNDFFPQLVGRLRQPRAPGLSDFAAPGRPRPVRQLSGGHQRSRAARYALFHLAFYR